ncbi:MAG: HINT domain-containing protein [Chloroflexi bacterium]|nr:HINT domain-containing protein [Chloroflexota bacterium]
MRTGEHLTSRDGEPVTVQSTTWHFSKASYTVYNFIVPQTHTYFVGRLGGGVWVHNFPCPPTSFFRIVTKADPEQNFMSNSELGLPAHRR